MKRAAWATVLPLLLLSPLAAQEHGVPSRALQQLGLGGMQTVSAERGMAVRGLSSKARTRGISIVSGLVVDPQSQSFVFGNDSQFAQALAENVGRRTSQAQTQQESNMNLNLSVSNGGSTFTGILLGGAGGSARARGR